eukprot:gene972-1484_t
MATSKEARRTSGAGYNAGDPVTMRGHACMEGSPAKLEPGLGESGGCLGYFGFAGAAPERRPRRELRRDWQCDTNAPRSYANHTEEIRHRLSRANGWKPPEARPFRAASAASDRPRLPAHRRDATRRRATDELRRRPSWRTSSCAIAIDNQFDPRALDDRVLPRARDSRAAPKALHDQLLPSAGDGHVISDAVFDRLTSRAGGNKLTSRHDQLNTGAAYGRPGSGAVDNALIRRNADDRLTSRAIHDRSVPSAEDSRPTPSPSSPALSYWPAADEYRAATARPGYQPNSRQAEDAAPLVRRRAEHRFSDPRAAVSAGLRRPAARERAGTVLEVSGPRCGEPRAFFTRGSCREAADQRPADAGVTREVKSGRGQDELRPPCLPQEGAEQPASMASRLQHDESRPFFTRGDSHEGADQRPTDLGGATRDIKNTWKQDEPRPLFMSQNSAEHMRHDESRPFFTRGNSSHGGGAAPDMKSPPRGSAPAAAQPQVPIRRGKAAAAGEAARRVHACTAGDFCHAVRFKRVRIQDWAGRLHARPLETGLPLAPADPDAAPPAALDPIPDGVPGSYLDPTAPALLSERHLLLHCQAVLQYEGAAYGVAPSRAHPSNRAGPGERTESAGFAEINQTMASLQQPAGRTAWFTEVREGHPTALAPEVFLRKRSNRAVCSTEVKQKSFLCEHNGPGTARLMMGKLKPGPTVLTSEKKSLHRVGHKTHLDGRLDDGCGFAGWSAPGVPAVPGRRHETDAGVVQESRSRTPRYSNDIAGWHATGRPADASVVSS